MPHEGKKPLEYVLGKQDWGIEKRRIEGKENRNPLSPEPLA